MYTLSLLALIGASQGLVLALVLFTQPFGFRIANQILAIFIAIHAIRLAVYHVAYANLIQHYPIIILLLNLNIALGPLLFCYVKALTEQEYKWQGRDFLHFLPTFFMLAYTAIMSFSMHDLALAYRWWQGDREMQNHFVGEIILVFSALYFLVYIIAAALRLAKHQTLIEEYFSNIDGKQLRWLWLVIVLCILIGLTTFVEQIVRHYTGYSLGERQVHVAVLTVVLIYFLSFMGMRQNFIFAPKKIVESDGLSTESSLSERQQMELDVDTVYDDVAVDVEAEKNPEKYKKSGLKQDELKPLWERLERLMLDQKPYLDSDLKLADLADQMGLSANYLSQVINRGGGKKFFDYINIYRVKEACELLNNTSKSSLLHIALDAGFTSQQAFSARFKKVMQKTPSQYRKDSSKA
ncbi:MAG: helix-turn-helix transcriptional regulator [Pseudomonadales bacterium]|nr:helix-turn-helix transcriptional regulator [Pseudomonadales bacterium]